jgi:hypothetical protein
VRVRGILEPFAGGCRAVDHAVIGAMDCRGSPYNCQHPIMLDLLRIGPEADSARVRAAGDSNRGAHWAGKCLRSCSSTSPPPIPVTHAQVITTVITTLPDLIPKIAG